MKYYTPDHMTTEKRAEFIEWYNDNYNTPFHLPDALREYGINDVAILAHALVKYRAEWIKITGKFA
jgi:hypothetical protein